MLAMYGVIAGLHVLGFFIFFVFVVPSHYKGLGIGVCILAYTLGLRHAFDADHISAIDNTTRKVMSERQGTGQPRPFGFGFFFSLGHSTVVVAIGIGIVVAEKTVFSAMADSGSGLAQFGSLFGTVVSAAFLLLIGLLNLVILAGITRIFASMRRGEYDEAELERQLASRVRGHRRASGLRSCPGGPEDSSGPVAGQDHRIPRRQSRAARRRPGQAARLHRCRHLADLSRRDDVPELTAGYRPCRRRRMPSRPGRRVRARGQTDPGTALARADRHPVPPRQA